MRKRSKFKIAGSNAFAFVVDGDTEVWYLQMLKRNERELNINIEPKLPSKKSIPEQFKMVKDLAEDYTKVFWIVDYDVIVKETREAKKGTETSEQLFIKLKEKAEKFDNVIVIVNNPCIEFWFLLLESNHVYRQNNHIICKSFFDAITLKTLRFYRHTTLLFCFINICKFI